MYSQLQQDFQLPSICTLTRITSKVEKVAEKKFLASIFKNLSPCQRQCVILWDEIYIKPALTYHGEKLFVHAIDYPERLAKIMLTVMIKSFYGGHKFIYKGYPISSFKAKFLYDEGQSIVKAIKFEQENKVIVVMTDEHCTNQKCFFTWAMDSPCRPKPWLSKNSDVFLLSDYVNVVKCLQNNWLTEKTKRLQYTFNGVTQVAK